MVNIIKEELSLEESLRKKIEFIKKILEKLFNNKVLSLFSFKHDYNHEERKANQEYVRKHIVYLIKEKFKKQQDTLTMKWKNQLKNYIPKKGYVKKSV